MSTSRILPLLHAGLLLLSLGGGLPPLAAQTLISITKVGAPDPVLTGANLTYTVTATNSSGLDLESAAVADTLPAGTTFVSLAAPAGWSCTAPAAGAAGTVRCDEAPMPSGSAVFTLVVQVGLGAGGSTLSNTASFDAVSNGRPVPQQTATATNQVLAPTPVIAIPALDTVGWMVLSLLLASAGWLRMRRGGSRPAA